jgi:hypothetical protein
MDIRKYFKKNIDEPIKETVKEPIKEPVRETVIKKNIITIIININKKEPTIELSKRFLNGYKKLMNEDFNSDLWRYCGGDRDEHLSYWRMLKLGKMPENQINCICSQSITENCFIENINTKKIIVCGNCCIKKFCKVSGRSCGKCGIKHRNRLNNYCSTCRIGLCLECYKPIEKIYKKCFECKWSKFKPCLE